MGMYFFFILIQIYIEKSVTINIDLDKIILQKKFS